MDERSYLQSRVEDAIESALGDDNVRLADVMFELVKNEEHYRILGKHCHKPEFLLRYLERLVPIRRVVYDDSDDERPLPMAPQNTEVPAVRQIVYDDSDGEVEKDQAPAVRQIVYDDSDGEVEKDQVPAVRQIVYDDSDGEVEKAQVPAVRQIVYDDSDGEVEKAQVLPRQIPYDDSDDEVPLGTDKVEVVVGPPVGIASLQEMALQVASESRDGTELETKTEPVAVELIDAADPSRMVELKPRGSSAIPDDVVKLAEGEEWVPMRTRGDSMLEPTGVEVEQMQEATPVAKASKELPQLEMEPPQGSVGEDAHVVQELKELPKIEMVDLVPPEPEAAEEEMVTKAPVSSSLFNPPAPASSSLFNPPSRPILFGKAPAVASKPDTLQQRLKKKREADAKNEEDNVNPDNEAETFTLPGSMSKEGTTPWVDPRRQKELDATDLPRVPPMHSGPAGTYDRDALGKWNRKGSEVSVSSR